MLFRVAGTQYLGCVPAHLCRQFSRVQGKLSSRRWNPSSSAQLISGNTARTRLKLQHAEADAVPRSHQQNDSDFWQQATPAGQVDSPGTGQQYQQHQEQAGPLSSEDPQGSSHQQVPAATPSQNNHETISRLQTPSHSNTQATSATLASSHSPSQAIGYDDYLDSHHGTNDDNVFQEAQLEPQTDLTGGDHSNTDSSFSTNTAAGIFAQARTWSNSLRGRLSSVVQRFKDAFKEERKYFEHIAKTKDAKERQEQYINFALGYLGSAAAIMFSGAFGLWLLYFGGRKLAVAVCQPSFYLCWVGVAVIGILTPQNPRNNELLGFLSNSNFFANYGQAKTFLNVLTYTSVGLLFAGVFWMGLA